MAAPPPIMPPSRPSARKWRWNCPAMKPSLAPTKCSTSTIGRLVAMAPRVAKVTDSMVATSISTSTPMPIAMAVRAMVRNRSIQPRWSSRLTPDDLLGQQAAQQREVGGGARA